MNQLTELNNALNNLRHRIYSLSLNLLIGLPKFNMGKNALNYYNLANLVADMVMNSIIKNIKNITNHNVLITYLNTLPSEKLKNTIIKLTMDNLKKNNSEASRASRANALRNPEPGTRSGIELNNIGVISGMPARVVGGYKTRKQRRKQKKQRRTQRKH